MDKKIEKAIDQLGELVNALYAVDSVEIPDSDIGDAIVELHQKVESEINRLEGMQ